MYLFTGKITIQEIINIYNNRDIIITHNKPNQNKNIEIFKHSNLI